jgi:hypothetical protein
MGWDSAQNWTTKSQVVAETTESLKRNGNAILAQKSTAAGVWYVIETKEQERLIYFALIKKERGEFARKTMTESMGPSYYCCPIPFFALVTCPEGYAKEWRLKVMELQKKKNEAKKLEIFPGMRFELYDKTYSVLGQVKQSWRVQEEKTGEVYRMGKKHLVSVKVLDTVQQEVL